MAPFTINVLLHIYAIAEPYPKDGCQAFKSAIDHLVGQNVIRMDLQQHSGYSLTVLGHEMVKRLLTVEVPRTHMFFVDDDGQPTGKVGD